MLTKFVIDASKDKELQMLDITTTSLHSPNRGQNITITNKQNIDIFIQSTMNYIAKHYGKIGIEVDQDNIEAQFSIYNVDDKRFFTFLQSIMQELKKLGINLSIIQDLQTAKNMIINKFAQQANGKNITVYEDYELFDFTVLKKHQHALDNVHNELKEYGVNGVDLSKTEDKFDAQKQIKPQLDKYNGFEIIKDLIPNSLQKVNDLIPHYINMCNFVYSFTDKNSRSIRSFTNFKDIVTYYENEPILKYNDAFLKSIYKMEAIIKYQAICSRINDYYDAKWYYEPQLKFVQYKSMMDKNNPNAEKEIQLNNMLEFAKLYFSMPCTGNKDKDELLSCSPKDIVYIAMLKGLKHDYRITKID